MDFIIDQPVLFKHCDPAGIVFYPRYFEMINDSIESFFEQVGYPWTGLMEVGGVPTAEISTRFLKPSRHGDQLKLQLIATAIGRTSLSLQISATCGDEQRFICQSVLVHVNDNGRPAAWPETVRNTFYDYYSEQISS